MKDHHAPPPRPPSGKRSSYTARCSPRALRLTASLLLAVAAAGCSPEGVVGGAIGATLLGGQSPAHEIEQVYYLGVFDPQEQVPPTVYRVTVRGQASALSNMKFGSGWVQANVIDSLNTHVDFDGNRPKVTTGEGEQLATLKTGRRLVLFGPEGFREAPPDHRLVIVMGASPEKFFNAIDTSLGQITQVQREQADSAIGQELFRAMSEIKAERDRLNDIAADVATDVPAPEGK
jgi:hypothetical protein